MTILNNLKAFNAALFKPNKVDALPIHLIFMVIEKCNIVCKTCYPRTGKKILDSNKFYDSIKRLPIINVGISGSGETLLYPDLMPLIKKLKSNTNPSVNVTTNGVLLEGKAEQLFKSGIDTLSISIDAATPETYSALRANRKNFYKILKGIDKINKLKVKYESRKPKLRGLFVVSKYNIEEVSQFVELSKSIGLNEVYFQHMIFRMEMLDWKEFLGEYTADEIVNKMKEAGRIADKLNIRHNCNEWANKDDIWQRYNDEPLNNYKKCIFPWMSLFAKENGDVYPCCMLYYYEPAKMGNLYEQDIEEIWNNKKYQKFRQLIKERKHPNPVCKKCLAPEIWDSMKRYLRLK
ncbi:MAG: SPASM domain-containing protein [Candidatus Aureabacteria bacterium]|nr:SPASM domain-containing protein [Candidatus Auribacterota bacterium]